MTFLIASLSRSARAYLKNPFSFIWATTIYLFLLLVSFFASFGIFIIYFMIAAILQYPIMNKTIPAIPTAVVSIISLISIYYFWNGLNASLALAYKKALVGQKSSLATFYGYALQMAPTTFIMSFLRELIWGIPVTILLLAYLFYLTKTPYAYLIIGLISMFIIFIVNLLFKPAILSIGTNNMKIAPAIKQSIKVLRVKHINFLGLYFLFAVIWLLNFVPLLNIISLFVLYPIIYGSIIMLAERVT